MHREANKNLQILRFQEWTNCVKTDKKLSQTDIIFRTTFQELKTLKSENIQPKEVVEKQ